MSQRYKFPDPPKIWHQSRGLFPEPYSFWPQLMLWEIDNVRAVVAESQLFLYVKLATGLHPRALEQIVYRRYMNIEPSVKNTFAMNFLQLSLQMLKDLQRGAACGGLCSLEEYKAVISNPMAHFEFRADMRRRFHSMAVVFEQGSSPDLYEELADSPLLSTSQLTLLCASLEEAENWIKFQVDLAEPQLATEAPELYLEKHALRATQRDPLAGISTSNASISQFPSLAFPAPPSEFLGEFIKQTGFDPSAAKQPIKEELQYIVLTKRLPSLHFNFTTSEPGRGGSQSLGQLSEFATIKDLSVTINTTRRLIENLEDTIIPVNRALYFSPNEARQACDAPLPPMRRRRRSTQGGGDRYGSQDEIEREVAEDNDNQPGLEYQVNLMAPPKRRRVVSHLHIRTSPPVQPLVEAIDEMEYGD